jgi:methionyl-tRNA formyltransferase
MPTRVAFLGSPDFAVPSLRALAAERQVALVVTQPDRPAGRGRHPEPTAVRRAAGELGLEVVTWERGGRAAVDRRLLDLQLDALVVVAFGVILKPSTLAAARCGAVNVHASLLPRWRGVAPIERALLAGDPVTGVTLMVLDAGVDTGPLLRQRLEPIAPDDTRLTLRTRLAQTGADLLAETLEDWVAGGLVPVPQDAARATYAPRLEKNEGRIDWHDDPLRIWYRVRGLYEWPGAVTGLEGADLKVHEVRPVDLLPGAEPGTIVHADARHGVLVACGGGTLELVQVQLAGRPRAPARDLVSGRRLRAGMRLG